jgi:hypothetical protein
MGEVAMPSGAVLPEVSPMSHYLAKACGKGGSGAIERLTDFTSSRV